MIENVLPLLVAVAAVTLTYFFCVRPMQKGNGCHIMPAQAGQQSARAGTDDQKATRISAPAPDTTDTEIKRLREEVQLLRHELEQRPASREAPGDLRLGKGEPR